jgi:hypothetical protein
MKIERLNYSRHPWRLLDNEGREVYVPQAFDHPALGMTVHSGPVCGATKTECVENALALLGTLLERTRKK